MTRKEYLNLLSEVSVNDEAVKDLENVYGAKISDVAKKIATKSSEPQGAVFFDDGYHALSFDEIKYADKNLHVDFHSKGMIPLIDCGDNDFIAFCFEDGTWCIFNITDETTFKCKSSLEELLFKVTCRILLGFEIVLGTKKSPHLARIFARQDGFAFSLTYKPSVLSPSFKHLRTVTDFINFSQTQSLQCIPLEL